MPPRKQDQEEEDDDEEGEHQLNLEARFGFDGAWYQVAGARVVEDGPAGKPALGVSFV